MHDFPLTAQVRLTRSVFILAAALTFAMAVLMETDSLSPLPHPAFLHGVIHDGDHDALHSWNR